MKKSRIGMVSRIGSIPKGGLFAMVKAFCKAMLGSERNLTRITLGVLHPCLKPSELRHLHENFENVESIGLSIL